MRSWRSRRWRARAQLLRRGAYWIPGRNKRKWIPRSCRRRSGMTTRRCRPGGRARDGPQLGTASIPRAATRIRLQWTPSYPYPNGTIGVYGLDVAAACSRRRRSRTSWGTAESLDQRLQLQRRDDFRARPSACAATPERSPVCSSGGGSRAEGRPRAGLPGRDSPDADGGTAGAYSVAGYAEDGSSICSISRSMRGGRRTILAARATSRSRFRSTNRRRPPFHPPPFRARAGGDFDRADGTSLRAGPETDLSRSGLRRGRLSLEWDVGCAIR